MKRIFICLLIGVMATAFGMREPSVSVAADPIKVVLGNARVTESSVAVADFNGDGFKEIVVGDIKGVLYVVSWTGSNWSVVWSRQTNLDIEAANPPTHTSDNNIRSSPAIADLDNDGRLEIVIGVGGDIHSPNLADHRNGGILVYRYNGSNPWNFSLIQSRSPDGTSGWPQPCKDEVGWPPPGYSGPDGYWDGVWPTPAVGDIDGDGDLEIVYLGIDRFMYAWHHDGRLVNGWPIAIPVDGGLSSPALGDLDLDGLPEIVVGTMSPPSLDRSWIEATLWAVRGNGTLVPGFPVRAEQILLSSPALGDIDNDGYLEIVIASGYGTPGRQNLVYAWNHDGTPVRGWPVEAVGASVVMAPPALGDIDNDGEIEIVVGCGNGYQPDSCDKLYAWNPDGTPMPRFPMALTSRMNYPQPYTSMPYSPVLADINGDGTVEILMGRLGDWAITVVNPVQGTYEWTSHQTPGGLVASPVVDDIDGDGLLETVIGGIDYNYGNERGAVYIWDETGPANPPPPWPMFHHDVRRTGRLLLPPRLEFPAEIRVFHQYGSGETAETVAFLKNRGDGQMDWLITHTISRLTVAPSSGTVITQTPLRLTITTTGLITGWHQLGPLTVTATANGSPVQGSPKVSNLYLFIGDLHHAYLPLVMRRY
ncbi:MAG: FG-GAP repeat domain-containing protein [Anaerolineae bacterium]